MKKNKQTIYYISTKITAIYDLVSRVLCRCYSNMSFLFKIFISKLLIFSAVWQIVSSECGSKPCIRMCCPQGMVLLPNLTTYTCQNYRFHSKIENEERFKIIYENKCPERQSTVDCNPEEFVFFDNGSLFLAFDNETTLQKPPNEYCINYTDGSTITVLCCTEEEPDQQVIGKSSNNFVCFYLETLPTNIVEVKIHFFKVIFVSKVSRVIFFFIYEVVSFVKLESFDVNLATLMNECFNEYSNIQNHLITPQDVFDSPSDYLSGHLVIGKRVELFVQWFGLWE